MSTVMDRKQIPYLPYEMVENIIKFSNSATLEKLNPVLMFSKMTSRELSKRDLYRYNILTKQGIDAGMIYLILHGTLYPWSYDYSNNMNNVNNITDETLKTISYYCPTIKYINLFGCSNITNVGIVSLVQGSPRLTEISLGNLPILDEGIIAIAKGCPMLEKISLYCNSNITDMSVTEIAKKCPKLTTIKISYCRKITDKSIIAIGQGCPKLNVLNISGCDEVTDKGIIVIGKNCPQLTKLLMNKLNGYRWNWFYCVTDIGIRAIAEGCPELTIIELPSYNITNNSVNHLIKKCPKLVDIKTGWMSRTKSKLNFATGIDSKQAATLLKYRSEIVDIDFNGCLGLTDNDVIPIIKKCMKVKQFDLRGCSKLSDKSIITIANYCPELLYIDFDRCYRITDNSIKQFIIHCPNIIEIGLGRCPKITEQTKQLLRDFNIKILQY